MMYLHGFCFFFSSPGIISFFFLRFLNSSLPPRRLSVEVFFSTFIGGRKGQAKVLRV